MIVFQVGIPAVTYQLGRLGIASPPTQNLSFTENKELHKGRSLYLMVNEKTLKSGSLHNEWTKLKDQFIKLKTFEYHPSKFVWSDERGDANLSSPPVEEISLYQFEPKVTR